MNRIYSYIVLFCIIYYSGLCHQDSELVGDSNDKENIKMSNRDIRPVEDENDDIIKKLNQQNSGINEDNNDGVDENLNNRDSEDARDDKNEDILSDFTQENTTQLKENVEKNEDLESNEESENNLEPEIYEAYNPNYFLQIKTKIEEMEIEREPGDIANFFGTNQHYNIPVYYQDFGRRFVLTYPYVEKKKKIADDAAEAEFDNTVKQHLESKKELTPVKAPPKFVLQIAKQSALLEVSKPVNPTNDIIQKDILRTGEYWDDVWKEEVDAEKMLRSTKNQNKLDSITVKISPGSKLYTLISILKQRSPRFLYVINKNTER